MLNIQWAKVKIVVIVSFFTVFFSLSAVSYAAHPLVTDDTGTQGYKNFQLELNSEFDHEDEDGANEDVFELATVLSYGITDSVDVILNIPYQQIRLKGYRAEQSENGLSDVSLELKWRFYEKDGLSFALKPVITLPTGDDEKGLGAGNTTFSAFFIASREITPWAFHLNLGYIRNENKADERTDLWHASLAGTIEVIKDLTLAANIGIGQNTDRNINTKPAFILGGLIYSISANLDIDLGVKGGLNKPETDYAVLAGMAWRF